MAGWFELLTKYFKTKELRDEFVEPDDNKNLIDEPSSLVVQHLNATEPLD